MERGVSVANSLRGTPRLLVLLGAASATLPAPEFWSGRAYYPLLKMPASLLGALLSRFLLFVKQIRIAVAESDDTQYHAQLQGGQPGQG